MKKASKRPVRYSKSPPSGYPSEAEWEKIEKQTIKAIGSKILPPNASPIRRTKQRICEEFIKYRHKEGITQRELARRLAVTESRVSEILHYHHERFTIDKLLDLLSRINPDVTLKVA